MFKCLYSEKLIKRAKRGGGGDPVATIAFYGPDDTRASKLVVTILISPEDEDKDVEIHEQKKWFSETADLRWDTNLCREVIAYIDAQGAQTVRMPEAIIGCPHEEGPDYPEGEDCPQCPFWAGRDRFSGLGLGGPQTAKERQRRALLLAQMAKEMAGQTPKRSGRSR